MKTFQLNGTARTDLGKKAVKGLRKQGLIPAVLNGGELVELPYQGALKPCEKLVELPGGKKGIIVTDFTVTKDAVRKLVYTPDIFAVELTIDGEKDGGIERFAIPPCNRCYSAYGFLGSIR